MLAVGSTADATLSQLQALADLPGVTEVDLAGQASRSTDVSVPAIHAAEPGHAATAGVPHLWSGSLPPSRPPTVNPIWSHNFGCSGGGGKTSVVAGAFDYVRDVGTGNKILNIADGTDTGNVFAPAGSTTAPAIDVTFNSGEGRIFNVGGGKLTASKVSDRSLVWTFTPAADTVVTAPVIVGTNVFVGASSGKVYAVPEAGNGAASTATWTGDAGTAISGPDEHNEVVLAGLGAGQGSLFVPAGQRLAAFAPASPAATTDTTTTYQVDATHDGWQPTDGLVTAGLPTTPKWQTADLGGAVSYPLVVGGKVFFTVGKSSGGGRLYALNQADGSTAWGPIDLDGVYQFSALAYDNGTLYAVVNNDSASYMAAYNPATAAQIWKTVLSSTYGQTYLFSSPPSARAGVVYTSGTGSDPTLYAIDGTDGHPIWVGLGGDDSSPAVTAEGVYVSYACDFSLKFAPAVKPPVSSFTGDTGKGVVVGVVDSGIDIQNTDFKTGTGTRIKDLWDQAASGSGSNPGAFAYGRECTQAGIDNNQCGPFNYLSSSAGGDCNSPVINGQPTQLLLEQDCIGHGTHVAGIAAANGRAGAGGQFIGVAPESDLVIVKNDGDLAHLVDGVNYVFQRAAALGQPASVNLSSGIGYGPHDGTSMFETMLDALSGPGRVITAAAGNQGTRGAPGNGLGGSIWYHASGALGPGQSQTNSLIIGAAPVAFDVWYKAGNQVSITVNGPNGFHLGPIAPDRGGTGIGPDGVCESANPNATAPTATDAGTGNWIQVISCTNMPNGDREIQFFIFNPSNADGHVNGCSPGPPCVDNWSFQLQAGSGLATGYHAWAFGQSDYAIHNSQGNDNSTVSAPASAHNVISAGSYNARNTWPSQAGTRNNGTTVGALSTFSALGPTRDGRQGIDIGAPGDSVGSSLSANASPGIRAACDYSNATQGDCTSPDGAHMFLAGTSMASPHVAGALALLLSQQPNLTPTLARRVLRDSALTDASTGATPNTRWGSGKLRLGPGVVSVTPSHGDIHASTPTTVCGVDFQPGMTVSYRAVGAAGYTSLGTPTVTSNCVNITMPPSSAPGPVPLQFVNPDNSSGTNAAAFAYEAAGTFTSLTPARILDTRTVPGGFISSGSTLSAQVLGRGGVPPIGVAAVVLNVTVTEPSALGFLTVWPSGVARPLASSLNFSAGQTVPNLVIVPVGADGNVNFYNGSTGTLQVIADVSGWFSTGSPVCAGGLTPLTPARILDTRSSLGAPGPVPAGGTASLTVLGHGGVPATGVSAVVLNVTVTEPGAGGFLTVWPEGVGRPLASNLNFVAGQTVPNLVVVPVGAPGKVDIYNGSGGTVQVIADVSGWFSTGPAAPGGLTPLTPSRVLDTRIGTGAGGPVSSGGTVSLPVRGHGGVPSSGVSAVVLNVTVTDTASSGFLTVWPDGVARPNASNLNFTAGQTVPNLVVAPVGADGNVDIFNGSAGNVQVIADVAGWFATL